jgi:hypothetical protein
MENHLPLVAACQYFLFGARMPKKKAAKTVESNKSLLSNPLLIVGIIAVIVVAAVLYQNNMRSQQQYPEGQNTNSQSTYTQNGYTYTQLYTQTQYTGQANSRAPTALTAFVSPDPVRMGGWVLGTLSSNGYNYPVTIMATHLGKGTQQSIAGFLGADGKWETAQQMNTPGYWQFIASVDTGTTSNRAQLTCIGINIGLSSDHYSKSFSTSITIEIYSHLSGNFQIIANDPSHGVSYDITNAAVNHGGYGSVAPSLSMLPIGNYEIDAHIGSEWAHDYGGTAWVTVGR